MLHSLVWIHICICCFCACPLYPPQWLTIKEGDDEKTVARKKKLLKSYKSKMRFQHMDVVQKEKQSSWQSFLKGKGSKKKTGEEGWGGGGWGGGHCARAA